MTGAVRESIRITVLKSTRCIRSMVNKLGGVWPVRPGLSCIRHLVDWTGQTRSVGVVTLSGASSVKSAKQAEMLPQPWCGPQDKFVSISLSVATGNADRGYPGAPAHITTIPVRASHPRKGNVQSEIRQARRPFVAP